MKKTIEYLILGSFILTLIAGGSLRLLDINKTAQIILLLIAVALLIIFVNLQVILILKKHGLDFYLKHGDHKMHFRYRLFVFSAAILPALPLGFISYNLAFLVWLSIAISLMFIIPVGIRLLYGSGQGQAGELVSVALGIILCGLVFLVITLVRR